MTTRFLIAASLLALAACGSKSDGNSSGGSGGGGLLGGPVQLQPGEWEVTSRLVDFKAPNMPASVTERMKAAPATTKRDCMTEEEAKGPKADSFAPPSEGQNCKQDDFVWGNGRIHGKTSCEGSNGAGKMSMTMDGTYTPTSMDITVKSENEVNHMPASMEMRISGRRIGECPAGEAGKAG